MQFPRVARFRTVADLRGHCESLGAPIPFDDVALSAAQGSPLAEPLPLGARVAGNRWCIHPMEGWDATDDGRPTDTLLRRWRHFGESGAKLIWGGEAVAVLPEGRANPNQLCAPICGRDGFALLLETVRDAHAERCGSTDDLIVALQLTHSGRFSKPTPAGRQPRIAYHHPLLDARHGVDPHDAACVLTDTDVEQLIDAYLAAARDAEAAGFDMVDIKACHGYLLHEFLSAGSPYTVPHIQRPAAFPPSDGYPPPEDPLIGVWRQLDACRQAKAAVPDLPLVGSGYTYLQDYLVHAAQAAVRTGWIDSVGLGRMVLSYPHLPADSLAGRPLARTSICRTFSDCTTAPRHGLRSGCYPLDDYYKTLPEAAEVKTIKAAKALS